MTLEYCRCFFTYEIPYKPSQYDRTFSSTVDVSLIFLKPVKKNVKMKISDQNRVSQQLPIFHNW